MFLNRAKILFILLFMAASSLCAKDLVLNIIWDSSLPKSRFSKLIKIKKNRPYSLRAVRRTTKLLYATKYFEQVVIIRKTDSNGNYEITIKGIPQLFISNVNIKGNSSISDRKIKMAADIGFNTPFFNSRLEKIREEAIFLYRQNGYFNAMVNVAVDIIDERSVSINVNIAEGNQEKIKRIKLKGKIGKDRQIRLKRQIEKDYINKPLTNRTINDIDDFIKESLIDEGYLDVVLNTEHSSDGTVSISLNRGSLFFLRIEGLQSFSQNTIDTVIRSVPNYHFDIESVKRKLLIFYQAYGFPDATIDVSINEDRSFKKKKDIKEISVNIQENQRRFVNDIIFTGASEVNHAIVVSRLKDFIEKKIEEENFPKIKITRSQTGGGYRDTDGSREKTLKRSRKDKVLLPDSPLAIPSDYLNDIRMIVKKVYQNEGYKDVNVSKVELINTDGNFYLQISVTENEQFMLNSVSVDTGDPILNKIIQKQVLLPKKIPFSNRIVKKYKERVRKYLSQNGYIFAWLTQKKEFAGNDVNLSFKAEYLFPVKIMEVVIAGNQITKSWVIKSILRINSGETLKGDTLTTSRRNLLMTGIFESARIMFIDPEFPNKEKDIVVVVSESERWKLVPGIGISSDEGVRITGSVEWKNVLETGFSTKLSFNVSRKLEIFMNDTFRKYYNRDYSVGETIERKINWAFIFPDLYIPFLPLSAQIEAFHIHDIRSNTSLPYMIDKNGLFFSFFRRFKEHFFLSTGLELAYQEERDHERDTDGTVKVNNVKRLLITPEFRGYIDYRDSLFFPTKGYKTSFKIFNKSSIYGSGSQYTQFENSLAIYIPLQYRVNFAGELVAKDTIIFHTFLKTAFILHHSGELSSDDVLKLGGSTTIRGFFNDEIMPSDKKKDQESNGKYSFIMRNELRFKLIESLYLITFLDLGNLWEEISNISENELFRYTSGGGLTYVSPIGAITAQVGFNLKPKDGEGTWAFHIFIATF